MKGIEGVLVDVLKVRQRLVVRPRQHQVSLLLLLLLFVFLVIPFILVDSFSSTSSRSRGIVTMGPLSLTSSSISTVAFVSRHRQQLYPYSNQKSNSKTTATGKSLLSLSLSESSDDTFTTTTTTSATQPDTNDDNQSTIQQQQQQQQRRLLGSQELLMLPRQYGVNPNVQFQSMNHVSCTIVRFDSVSVSLPSKEQIEGAVDTLLQIHPLLNSYIEGDGEPEKRIDFLQMVRSPMEPNPLQFVCQNPNQPTYFTAKDIVKYYNDNDDNDNENTKRITNENKFQQCWQTKFQKNLDEDSRTSWCPNIHTGPLWKLEIYHYDNNDNGDKNNNKDNNHKKMAFVFTFHHAISDQSSANRIMDQLLHILATTDNNNNNTKNQQQQQKMPVSLEESVLGYNQTWKDIGTNGMTFDTIQYIMGKALEGFKNPVILPDPMISTDNKENKQNDNPLLNALTIISGKEAGGKDTDTQLQSRKSNVQFRNLSKETTQALLQQCRIHQVSISNVLTAAVTYTTSDFISSSNNKDRQPKQERYYKILQSLDMRRFGKQLDQGTTVACMAGSHDLLHGPIVDFAGYELRKQQQQQSSSQQKSAAAFWELAKMGKEQTLQFIRDDNNNNYNGPKEAVRVFDFAMSISDLNNLVYLSSQSKSTKGRAYSAGVTNVGVYEQQTAFEYDDTNYDNNEKRNKIQLQHGPYCVENVYYATPHTRSGCLYPVSCMTVNGMLQCTMNPVEPIVDEETTIKFADALIELLETVAGTRNNTTTPSTTTMETTETPSLPSNILSLIATGVGSAMVLSHWNAYTNFFQSIDLMRTNIVNPEDFNAALNFWIFFAVAHPILSPILWISDVLHGSPGPLLANLIPFTFIAGNILAIAAITMSKEIRNAVNIAAFAAFLSYVGAGLDGTGGLGDFNLALDDPYQGRIVKGCPTYEQVRQPSMNDFDLKKYQGLWYEHKFHDWTQFKEVYDTTLDIKLTEDGTGWVDDFAVKGPAPDSAKLSWDKSPVANGAHYFLFGRVDPDDPPGILREKGFGVEFPNYIVDVKKDSQTGEYTEAIQFQCLERGGVRVFEGINFMSRNPVMTDTELDAMHQRAEQAGMYPYGASPEQMHRVARRPVDAPPIDNNWQALWRAIGVDKLLQLLTESIEDGGR